MENTVEKKLASLLKLQELDSKHDEIKKIRGDLPEEVRDLEDEIIGYETRLNKFDDEVKELEIAISDNKTGIKNAERLIEKYKEQQMNVRNNREYDAISKEVELQELEMQISDKRINETRIKIERKQSDMESTRAAYEERKKDMETKRAELETIIAESEEEEQKLMKSREKAAKILEERIRRSYERIRGNSRNGLAVVTVKRDACGGCFNTVPPQRQADIREKKKLIVCEHCGRILADVDDVAEVEKPVAKKRTSRTAAAK